MSDSTARCYINVTEQGTALTWMRILEFARAMAKRGSTLTVGVSRAQADTLHDTWADEVDAITPAPDFHEGEDVHWISVAIRTVPPHEELAS